MLNLKVGKVNTLKISNSDRPKLTRSLYFCRGKYSGSGIDDVKVDEHSIVTGRVARLHSLTMQRAIDVVNEAFKELI